MASTPPQHAGAQQISSPQFTSSVERSALLRALKLAERGPKDDPNPQVGCVLLNASGQVLGEGWHRGAGTPHAEVAAIANTQANGHQTHGATAIVTLQPCATHGRTPPCTSALIDAGVSRVIFAAADPTQAEPDLRESGIAVVGPEHLDSATQSAAQRLADRWLAALPTPPVRITLKLATTLDGRIAAADGTSQWITGPQARAHAHAQRATTGALIIGTGTALADNPSLTARGPDGALAPTQPLRVVMGHREIPEHANLRGPGGGLLHLRTHHPATVLHHLHGCGITSAIVEGGPQIAAAFLRANAVTEVHTYLAPALLGAGATAITDLGIGTIADALRLTTRELIPLGNDVLLITTKETHVHRPS